MSSQLWSEKQAVAKCIARTAIVLDGSVWSISLVITCVFLRRLPVSEVKFGKLSTTGVPSSSLLWTRSQIEMALGENADWIPEAVVR